MKTTLTLIVDSLGDNTLLRVLGRLRLAVNQSFRSVDLVASIQPKLARWFEMNSCPLQKGGSYA